FVFSGLQFQPVATQLDIAAIQPEYGIGASLCVLNFRFQKSGDLVTEISFGGPAQFGVVSPAIDGAVVVLGQWRSLAAALLRRGGKRVLRPQAGSDAEHAVVARVVYQALEVARRAVQVGVA